MNGEYRIEQWCDTACSYIRFKPDRAGVKQELLWHFEDKCNVLTEAGVSFDEAAREVTADMGSPEETGRLLRVTHKPYLGWIWVASKWFLALAVIAMLIAIPGFHNRRAIYENKPMHERAYTQTCTEYGTRTFYTEPGCSAQSDGYTFTVTRAAQWHYDWADERDAHINDGFYFTIRATNLLTWAGAPDGVKYFYAVDSNGNYYVSNYNRPDSDGLYMVGNLESQGLFSYTYDMWLENYVSGTEWIEIRYDRSGRSFSMHIDLAGGESD